MNPPCPQFFTMTFLRGIEVQLMDKDQLIACILKQVGEGRKTLIPHHNLHSVYLYHASESFRNSYDSAEITHVDGMPLILWGKLLGYPCQRSHRCTYLDWAPELLRQMEQQNLRVACIGGRPVDTDTNREALRTRYPDLDCWFHHGFFDRSDAALSQALLTELKTFDPQVTFVGMGMPLQEEWITEHLEAFPDSVILPCGGFLDYLAGRKPSPNRGSGRWGLEWFVRFLNEPRRLFSRYFIEPWFLIPSLAADLLRLRHHRAAARQIRENLAGESLSQSPVGEL